MLSTEIPTSFSLVELLDLELPEQRWVVHGLIPEGLTVVAGPPKVSKSWLALQLAVGVALGDAVLGRKAQQGAVLYLALEDNPRRLKTRATMVLDGRPGTPDLAFATRSPRSTDGSFDWIERWVGDHDGARLVIIDTWGKVRPPTQGRRLYDDDYQALEGLHGLARDSGMGVIVVHHHNKGTHEDWIDSISGTTGVTGAADTLISLSRERMQADARLRGTGRDIDEFDLALRFDRQTGSWSVAGPTERFILDAARRSILDYLDAQGPSTPQEIAAATGSKDAATRQLLKSMSEDGQVSWLRHGVYALPSNHNDHPHHGS